MDGGSNPQVKSAPNGPIAANFSNGSGCWQKIPAIGWRLCTVVICISQLGEKRTISSSSGVGHIQVIAIVKTLKIHFPDINTTPKITCTQASDAYRCRERWDVVAPRIKIPKMTSVIRAVRSRAGVRWL
jgi:hypothetical protein